MAGSSAVTIFRPGNFMILDNFGAENIGSRKFRVHSAGTGKDRIRVAGCGQPKPVQIAVFSKEENIGVVVDLREEAHGFIRPKRADGQPSLWMQVTYTDICNAPNPGISSKKLLADEKKLFERIRRQKEVDLSDITWKNERFVITGRNRVPIEEAFTEKEMVSQINTARKRHGDFPLKYERLPVTDLDAFAPKAVDRLVKIYQAAAREGKGILFHCVAGENRTTTALVMTRIMDGMGVHDALHFEGPNNPILEGNGTSLRSVPGVAHFDADRGKGYAMRLACIYKFGEFWSQGHQGSFESYMRKNPIDAHYLSKMMAKLRVRQE